MDLDAVRTFVAVAEAGQFQEAASELSITQQAVSKRVAALEKELGVRLFTRTPRGARLTGDGRSFLPHARDLLRAEIDALASVRGGGRPLRVDVIGPGLAPAAVMRSFHQAHPDVELDVVTHFDVDAAIAAVVSGAIDASFRAVTMPTRRLPDEVAAAPVLDEPVQLLTGAAHRLAAAGSVALADLARERIWMPGLVAGTEWAAFYDDLAAAFGFAIDPTGPHFGGDFLLGAIADSPATATLVGEGTRVRGAVDGRLWRVPLRDPTPVYPHSLLWRRGNPHPALVVLCDHLTSRYDRPGPDVWAPRWARPDAPRGGAGATVR